MAVAPSLTERLLPILARPVDGQTRERASLHLLDWIGCAVAGAASEAGAVFLSHAAASGPGPARVIGGGSHAVANSLFANGAFGNVLEMDDVHRKAILHPGPVVAPVALALAEATGASGTALLDAIVRGYEAEIRLGRSLGPSHYARFHNTATAGPMGAVIAAADLLGLSREQMVHAIGNAITQAGGLWQCRHEPVMTKQLHTARAAWIGFEAAELARHGLTGPRLILEGPQGFFAGLAPDGTPAFLLADPDGPWLIHETSFKPWPACRHCHPAIDAALALRGRPPIAAIRAIAIETYRDGVVFCDKPQPSSTIEGKFSLQHAVAITLADGPPPLAAFDPEAMARAEVTTLRALASVSEAPDLTAAYPAHFGARVTLTLADGTSLTEHVPDALGDPENPISAEAISAKARTLMAFGGVGASRIERVIAATLALAEGGPVSALTEALP